MASAVYLWSSFRNSQAEAHQPKPTFQAHKPMLGSSTSRFKRDNPVPAPAEALPFPAKRPQLGLGFDLIERIRLLKIYYKLSETIPYLAQSFPLHLTYSTMDHDLLSYFQALLEAKLMAASIFPGSSMSEEAGLPVAMAGSRDPTQCLLHLDLVRIPAVEDPGGFPCGPSVSTSRLPSQPRDNSSFLWDAHLKNKVSNCNDSMFGELNSGGSDLMKVPINGSDHLGPNIGKGKAIDEGTCRDFGGNGQWPGSSSGLHVVEKNENSVPKKKGKAAVNRRPKECKFFPVKKVCSKGKRGGSKAATLTQAKTIAGPIDLTLKLGPIGLTLKL